jgi:Zn-dependent protease with chaperone function
MLAYYKRLRTFEEIKIFLAWVLSCGFYSIGLISTLLLSLLLLAELLGVFFIIAGKSSENLGSSLFIVIILSLAVAPRYHFLLRFFKQYSESRNLTGLTPLPLKQQKLLAELYDEVMERIPKDFHFILNNHKPEAYLEIDNLSAAPSMIRIGKRFCLIIPLGFFKIIRSDRPAARAVLAHELAHLVQNDSGRLLQIRTFFYAGNIMFYYFAIHLFLGLFLLALTFNTTRPPDLSPIMQESIDAGLHYTEDELKRWGEYKKAQTLNTQIQKNFWSSILIIIYYYALRWFLKRRVSRAEHHADLFAASVISDSSMLAFIYKYLYRYEEYDSLHPNFSKRIEFIQNYSYKSLK